MYSVTILYDNFVLYLNLRTPTSYIVKV